MADEALEHIGTSVTLVEFHPIPSRCNISLDPSLSDEDSTSSNVSADSLEEPKTQAISDTFDDDDDDGVKYEVRPIGTNKAAPNEGPNTLWDLKNSSYHPFIVTRSQLVVIDETRPLDLKAVTEAFRRLRAVKVNLYLPHLRHDQSDRKPVLIVVAVY